MRRFAATIRGSDPIKELNPLVRWGVGRLALTGSVVSTILGQYNPYDIEGIQGSADFNSINNSIELSNPDLYQNTSDRVVLSTPTSSECVGVVYIDNTLNSNSYLFIGTNTQNRVILFSLSQRFEMGSNNVSATLDRVQTTSTFPIGFYICSWIATGSTYKIHVNNPTTAEALTLVSGTNTGRWSGGIAGLSANTGTKTRIAEIAGTNAFRDTIFKDMVYFDRELTTSERTIVFNKFNSLYSVY